MSYTPPLNLQKRKSKGLVKLFGGVVAPFYYTNVVVKEGTPMKRGGTANLIVPCEATDGEVCIGLATQETYDDTQNGQLQGYHYANDTRQRLDGNPIGLLTGQGYALTNYWTGTAPVFGDAAYITPSGLSKTGAAGAKLPVVFEGTQDPAMLPNLPEGTTPMMRIRFDFPLV